MSFSPFAQGKAASTAGSSVAPGRAVIGAVGLSLLLAGAGCSGKLDAGPAGMSAGGDATMMPGTMVMNGVPTPGSPVVGTGGAATTPITMPAVTPPDPTDWFAAVQSADCSATATPTLERTRIRRLSNTQWVNTVQAALGATVDGTKLPSDGISSSTWFNTDAVENKVNVLLANAYFDMGTTLAPAAATAALAAYPCLSTMAADPTCSSPFINDYGQKLFRRPLNAEETTRYAALLTGQAALDSADVAVGTVIRAMLMSPNMIYLTELGASTAGQVALTPYEQAELISYMIADVPPDQMLMQAAAANQLATPADRATHATRLLQSPGARAKYEDFWKQYLPVGDLRQATALPADVVTAMGSEPQTQFDKIVWDQGGSFKDLLTSAYTYGDQKLSPVYGTMTPDATQPGRSTLTAGQRSGFVTEPAVLFASPDSTVAHKVIQRGLIIRNRLLCKVPSPPPPNLKPDPAAFTNSSAGPDATAYEAFQAFSAANPACAACHSGFQPYGLAFEAYDSQGKFQQNYPNGKPIITSGQILDAGDATGPYNNAVEMAGLIGNSEIGEYCFSRQYGEYALGRHLNASVDACTIKALGDTAPDSAVKQLAVVLSEIEAGSNRIHTVVQ
ncbi:MAG TPA: DUF1592 domain-containing protein [Polyangiaceae bacterium]|nr:DUF1592 domain-containing protein [Polyangiaceae bacterium]